MVRLWLSRNAPESLREQLTTQLMLAMISQDLKAGEKLPSVRELARRYGIHANTASAAYKELQSRGWLDFRRGSGVYVRDLKSVKTRSSLDQLIEGFFIEAQRQGFALEEVRERLDRWMEPRTVSCVVVIEPEPELREIMAAELRDVLPLPVEAGTRAENGSLAVALGSRADELSRAIDPGTPSLLLKLRSVADVLAGQQRPDVRHLLAVASSSPEVLRRTRTILLAAALDADAMEFRDAREDGWDRGLELCHFVISDVITARLLPAGCTVRPLHVLAESSLDELREMLAHMTEPKVS